MSYELDRFVVAQDCIWEKVLAELRAARKECHWMWFVFPQIAGLGSTATSRFYAIGSLDEARAYLAHPTLGARLREAARLVLAAPAGTDAESIFGLTDARKLRSSMTLFLRAEAAGPETPSDLRAVLDRYFDGEPDPRTDQLLTGRQAVRGAPPCRTDPPAHHPPALVPSTCPADDRCVDPKECRMSVVRSVIAATLVPILAASLIAASPDPVAARRTRPRLAATSVTGAWVHHQERPFDFGPDLHHRVWLDASDASYLHGEVKDDAGDVVFGYGMASPRGTTIAVGTYTDAVAPVWRDDVQPGLEMSLRGVTSPCSSFTIHELTIVDGSVTAFAADFTYRRACGEAASTWGRVRFQSSVDYRAVAIRPWWYGDIDMGGGVFDIWSDPFPFRITASGSEPLTVQAPTVSTDRLRIARDGCSGAPVPARETCTIEVEYLPDPHALTIPNVSHGTLTVETDAAPGHPNPIPLAWHGGPWSVAPTSLTFAPQERYSIGPSQIVEFRTGGSELVMPFLDLPVGFVITRDTCGMHRPAFSTCELAIAHRPLELGEVDETFYLGQGARNESWPRVRLHARGVTSSSVAWGDRSEIGARGITNGGSLAAAPGADAGPLEQVRASAWIRGRWASDRGPYLAIYLSRRPPAGGPWSPVTRVNPRSDHGDAPGIAVAGGRIHVAWIHRTTIAVRGHAVPGGIEVRTGSAEGDPAFGPITALSPAGGKVDVPSVAASGDVVLVAWTDAATGSITVARSEDGGGTYAMTKLGATGRRLTGGRVGMPDVAIDGSQAEVAWIADAAGTVRARRSDDRGATWGPVTTLGAGADRVSVAADGGRLVTAWATAAGVRVRIGGANGWTDGLTIAPPGDSPAFRWLHAADVAMRGDWIGIAWTGCRTGCNRLGTWTRVDLMWAESTDGGETFPARQMLAVSALRSGEERRVAIAPSVAWSRAAQRDVIWTSIVSSLGRFGVWSLTGTGEP